MYEPQKRARKKYEAKNRKRFMLEFYPAHHDLFDHVKKQPNQQEYVRELIRKDMERK